MALYQIIFSILSFLISVYALLCTVKIILSWIPGTNINFTRFLSNLCNPYLNLFSKTGLLRFGQLDFSPVISIGLLSLISTVCSGIASEGRLGLGTVLAIVIKMTLYTATSMLNFLILLLLIRFIFILVQRTTYTASELWKKFDYFISPFVYKISRFFSGGRMISYKSTLLISIIILSLVSIVSYWLINKLIYLVNLIPF